MSKVANHHAQPRYGFAYTRQDRDWFGRVRHGIPENKRNVDELKSSLSA